MYPSEHLRLASRLHPILGTLSTSEIWRGSLWSSVILLRVGDWRRGRRRGVAWRDVLCVVGLCRASVILIVAAGRRVLVVLSLLLRVGVILVVSAWP